MQISNNKFITILVSINIVAFATIFILIWLLWKDQPIIQQPETDLMSAAKVQTNPSTSLTRKTVSVIDKVIKEVKVSDFEIDQFLTQESNSKNSNAEDKSSLNPTEKINPDKTTSNVSDQEYVDAYKKLNTSEEPAKVKFTDSDVKMTTAADDDTNITTNHFNKIDVSKSKNITKPDSKDTLAALVEDLVTSKEDTPPQKNSPKPAWKDYLNVLQTAEAERKNEMRTITVRRGDTLWRISIRAYGTGFLYKKIFKANPHLTSPNDITTGETLRVPL